MLKNTNVYAGVNGLTGLHPLDAYPRPIAVSLGYCKRFVPKLGTLGPSLSFDRTMGQQGGEAHDAPIFYVRV